MKTMTSAILIAAALLGGCVTSGGPRDSGGKRMQLSEWQETPKTGIIFNLADLGGISEATLETRTRSNAIAHQRARFGDRWTSFFIEHLSAGNSVYNYATTERCLSEEVFRTRAEKAFGKDKQTIAFERVDRLRRYNRHGGFLAVARVAETGDSCTVGGLCFLSARKNPSQTDERFDSVIRFRDCAGKWSFDEMKTWLQGIRILRRS